MVLVDKTPGVGQEGPVFDLERTDIVLTQVEWYLVDLAIGVVEEASRPCTRERGLDLRTTSPSSGKPSGCLERAQGSKRQRVLLDASCPLSRDIGT